MNISDYMKCFVAKWRLVVAATLVGALLGLAYVATYAVDNDPYPYKASKECAVAIVKDEKESGTYTSRMSILERWAGMLVDNDYVSSGIFENEDVVALANEVGESPETFVAERVSFRYDTNSSILDILVIGKSEQEVVVLGDASVKAFERALNAYFGIELGAIDVKVVNEKTGLNGASGVAPLQIGLFAAAGLVVGFVVAAVIVLLGDYVTYGSLIRRYGLPVYGPYGKKGERKAEKSSLREGAYEGFPSPAMLVLADTLKMDEEELKKLVAEKTTGEITVEKAGEMDEALSLAESGYAPVLVVRKGRTAHGRVRNSMRLLEAYGVEFAAFCLIEV